MDNLKLSFNEETREVTTRDGSLICTMSPEAAAQKPIVDGIVHGPEAMVLCARALTQLSLLVLSIPQHMPASICTEFSTLAQEFGKLTTPADVTTNQTIVFDDK